MEITINEDKICVAAVLGSPESVEDFVRRLYLAQEAVWQGSLDEPESEVDHCDPAPAPREEPAPKDEPQFDDASPQPAPAAAKHQEPEAELSSTQLRVLSLIRSSDKLPPALQIANSLGIAEQTARNIIALLRKKGLLS